MKKSMRALTALLAVILLIFVGSCLRRYRDMEAMEERIEDSWMMVDSALQVRNDLIPELVNTAKGHVPGEREVFEGVIRARVGMSEARDIGELSRASADMENALADLLAVVDGYPLLKDDQDFNRLRHELAETERRIVVECRNYNESVREFNACLEPFPNNIVAGVFGFARNETSFDTPDEGKELVTLDWGGEA